jgi:predicted N-acyltransferase
MAQSISGTGKRGRGRPAVHPTSIHLSLRPDLLAALDRYIAEEKPDVSRPEALRIAFRDWAEQQGYLAPETD